MSFDIDRAEFDEAVEKGNLEWLWSAYEALRVELGKSRARPDVPQCFCTLSDGKKYLCERCAQSRESEHTVEMGKLKDHIQKLSDSQLEAGKLMAEQNERFDQLSAHHKEYLEAEECFVRAVAKKLDCQPYYQHILEALDDKLVCFKCRERERIMASLPQDGSRGQKDAWDELLDRISLNERRYEQALTYAGLPSSPEQAREEIEKMIK